MSTLREEHMDEAIGRWSWLAERVDLKRARGADVIELQVVPRYGGPPFGTTL